MALKSADATIDFLLTAIDCVEGGKVDWEAVAIKTGWYKGAKFSKRAFNTIQKKYAGNAIGNTGGANEASPSGRMKASPGKIKGARESVLKKRAAATDDIDDDMGQDEKKIKLEEDVVVVGEVVKACNVKAEGIKTEVIKTEAIEIDGIKSEGFKTEGNDGKRD